MEILKDIEIIDLALYLKPKKSEAFLGAENPRDFPAKDKALIISDTHIGYEESLNKQGIFIPRFSFKDTIVRLEKILKKVKNIETIVINGDIKHEFGSISETEWRNTLKLIDFLGRYTKDIVLIKGNHDKILGPIANKRNILIKDNLIVRDVLIVHGDTIPDKRLLKKVKTIIMGHEHPAITIRDNSRAEKYKCFLKGKYQRKNLIVQPSFNLVNEGTDIKKEELLSPLLKQDLSDFEAFIVSDKVYYFGKIKDLEE